jgi:exodeoxyribonuclease VII large subunit
MRIFSVSELTECIRENLETAFTSVQVEGELSNYRPSSTGHLYFTLKDPGAVISGVLFKNRIKSLSFAPRDGMLLRVRGRISVYGQRGTYQIVCEELELAGTGDILAVLEKRKQMFAAEGLFDPGRKKSIPRFPKTVGVVSSPTGAAVRDILNIIRRRAEGMEVVILPAPVQGSEAGRVIARRIEQANQWALADVLIIGRGGGSLEDLLPFSEECVVRAVAASAIPIVSAVGHEIDYALSDFAADLRAPTPSAAAELVSPDREETRRIIFGMQNELCRSMQERISRIRSLAKPFSKEELEYRFRALLQPRLMRFEDAKEGVLTGISGRLSEMRRRLELALTSLEAGSPQSILERGFSVVIDSTGKPVRSAEDTSTGDTLIIRPLRGTITAAVTGVTG